MDLFSPLTVTEIEELENFLLSLESDESFFCVSELDGFLTAVVSGPDMIPPSEWMAMVWGGEEQSPAWDTMEDFERIFGLMARLMNSIAAVLMESPGDFEALFIEREAEGKTYLVVDEWCMGFMRGVGLRAKLWDEMPDPVDYLAPIMMFATDTGLEQLDEMPEMEVEFWQHQIEPAVRRIHAYWLEHRNEEPGEDYPIPSMMAANDEPFRRDHPKIGRNDICPCGSGKKYKKCCGLN